MNRTRLYFLITTGLLALMYLGGGARYFIEYSFMSDYYELLGFPRWLHPLLGITKFMAVISLVTILFDVKANPNWLKEWTYAGIFINGTLAFVSHLMIDEPFYLSIPAVMVIVLVILSRILWGKRNLSLDNKE